MKKKLKLKIEADLLQVSLENHTTIFRCRYYYALKMIIILNRNLYREGREKERKNKKKNQKKPNRNWNLWIEKSLFFKWDAPGTVCFSNGICWSIEQEKSPFFINRTRLVCSSRTLWIGHFQLNIFFFLNAIFSFIIVFPIVKLARE